MQIIVTLLALLLSLFSSSVFSQQDSTNKPDVLFIAIDDLNDWVGVLGGNPQIKTPNIDELASRGMLFRNAHTPAAACLPTRTAILSGMSPFSSGVYTQLGDWRTNPTFDDKATIPSFFRQNDYLTLGAGKLFHAHTYSLGGYEGQNDPNGWDAYFPSIDRALPDEVVPVQGQTPGPAVGNGMSTGHFDFFPTVTTDDAMGDGQVVSWVEDQIEAASTGPRFIATGLFRPHLPWYAPKKYFDMYPLESIELPPYLDRDLDDVPKGYEALIGAEPDLAVGSTHQWVLERGTQKWQEAIQGYMASISFTDAMVGRLLDALDESGRADNTIIVLWSDHGFHLGEKNVWGKMTFWDETTRVPFIIVAPGVTTPGSVSDEVVSTQSIYATLAELTGLQLPEHVDGSSLVPLLRNPSMEWDDVAITTYGDYGNFSVRGDMYRYTIYSDGDEELYDLESDPNEWLNLADDPNYAAIKESLALRIPPVEEHAPPVRGIDELQQGAQ
jgi:arylsulfatase A-like enzyme